MRVIFPASAGLLVAGLIPLGRVPSPAPAPSLPAPRLLSSDAFGLSRLDEPGAPIVLSGTVERVHAGSALEAGPMRIDVYLNPRKPGPLYPFAFTLTGRNEASFTVRRRLDPSEARFTTRDGSVNATVMTTDLTTGSMAVSGVQLRWSADTETWERLDEAGALGKTQVPTMHQVVQVSSPSARSASASGVDLAEVDNAAACRPYTAQDGSDLWGISLLPQPSTKVVVSMALAEDLDVRVGEQVIPGNDWTISSEYSRADSTRINYFDGVKYTADFDVKFPQIGSLAVGGSRQVSTGTGNESNTSLSFGYAIRNRPTYSLAPMSGSPVDVGSTINNKYTIPLATFAGLMECVNPTLSYVNGYTTYEAAYYTLVVSDQISEVNGEGFDQHPTPFLAMTGPEGDVRPTYVRPCGSATAVGDAAGDTTWGVNPGGYFKRSNGQGQHFEKGTTVTYSGALSVLAARAGEETTQSKNSSVTNQDTVWTQWSNNSPSKKFVCAYGDSPVNQTETFVAGIVGVGLNPDGS